MPLADAGWRLFYRIAFRLLRLWWAIRRPARHGVVVAVWCRGQLLILRQSYRPGPTFPGGGLKSGETPLQAARRELREEVGIEAPAAALREVRQIRITYESCRDEVTVFALDLASPPALRPDNREIVAADFLDPAEALAAPDLSPFARITLEGHPVPGRG